MRRRLGFYAAPLVLFFLIRLAIRLLAREAAPPHGSSSVVSRRDPEQANAALTAMAVALDASPVTLQQEMDRDAARRNADARLLAFAHDANAAGLPRAAVAAHAASSAVQRGDCAGARTSIGRAGDLVGDASALGEPFASAVRAVDAFCATLPE